MATVKELKAAVASIPEEYDEREVQLEGCDCVEAWCGHIHVEADGLPDEIMLTRVGNWNCAIREED